MDLGAHVRKSPSERRLGEILAPRCESGSMFSLAENLIVMFARQLTSRVHFCYTGCRGIS